MGNSTSENCRIQPVMWSHFLLLPAHLEASEVSGYLISFAILFFSSLFSSESRQNLKGVCYGKMRSEVGVVFGPEGIIVIFSSCVILVMIIWRESGWSVIGYSSFTTVCLEWTLQCHLASCILIIYTASMSLLFIHPSLPPRCIGNWEMYLSLPYSVVLSDCRPHNKTVRDN